jgi:hypothetical protein
MVWMPSLVARVEVLTWWRACQRFSRHEHPYIIFAAPVVQFLALRRAQSRSEVPKARLGIFTPIRCTLVYQGTPLMCQGAPWCTKVRPGCAKVRLGN